MFGLLTRTLQHGLFNMWTVGIWDLDTNHDDLVHILSYSWSDKSWKKLLHFVKIFTGTKQRYHSQRHLRYI